MTDEVGNGKGSTCYAIGCPYGRWKQGSDRGLAGGSRDKGKHTGSSRHDREADSFLLF